MKRFAAIVTAGLVATTLFTTYVVARPQKILGIEYKIETPATAENVVLDSSQIYYLYSEPRRCHTFT
ncbi:MAG: hypothetical protein LUH47_00195 [Clostridiales bacterium]|nr:hypothetical protein [Clostridiales bacterium]